VTFPGHREWTHLIVTVDADLPEGDLSPKSIRIDLAPIE